MRTDGKARETLSFRPFLSMNDYAGLAYALIAGMGIGDLPPVVSPGLVSSGQLVEVIPKWHMRIFDLTMVHLGNRHVPRRVRVFKEFAAKMAPTSGPSRSGRWPLMT